MSSKSRSIIADDAVDATHAFDQRLDAAISIAESFSGFSSFHSNYRPLFKKFWLDADPKQTGYITPTQAEAFAAKMDEDGRFPWNVTDRERSLWNALAPRISLEHFAEISENKEFRVPSSAAAFRAVKLDNSDDEKEKGGEDNEEDNKEKETRRHGCASSKAEAGRMMMASHAERHSNFQMPPETETVQQAVQWGRPSAYCEGFCINNSMSQMPICGLCRICGTSQTTSNQAFCDSCALNLGRCAACAKKFANAAPVMSKGGCKKG